MFLNSTPFASAKVRFPSVRWKKKQAIDSNNPKKQHKRFNV